MRMRTLPEAINIIKKEDPETCLTIRALRRMIDEGKIPFAAVGNKRLIDLDTLGEYLFKTQDRPHNLDGQIQAIAE